MRFLRIASALAGVLLLGGAALAADLPVKAPLQFGGPYPTKNCGLYYGINAEGGAGVVNGAPPGTTVVGGDIGALIGYACPGSGFPWFVEAIFDFQNLNAGNNGFSLTGPAHLEQRLGLQTPLLPFFSSLFGSASITSAVQTPSLPMLPPGYAAGPPQNYIYAAIDEDDISSTLGLATAHEWMISPEVGTGILFNLSALGKPTIVADVYAGVELQSSAACLGGTGMCPKLGQRFKTGVSFKY